jgi:hypothetical protein
MWVLAGYQQRLYSTKLMSHLFTLPHLFILLDGLAGVLVMLNFVLPKEHYENANLRLRRLLARLGSDHLILLALATWFVVSAGVVGHAIYKDVVNNSFVSELYSARTMMTIIGIALGRSGDLALNGEGESRTPTPRGTWS